MYRIQAYNHRTKHWVVHMCRYMEERDKFIRDLLATGDYHEASISFEWLARHGGY